MMSLILAAAYPLAIQYRVRGWLWLLPFTLLIVLIDIWCNYTELAVLTGDFPKAGEYTFSQRLVRLQTGNRWQRCVARVVIPYLNYFDPGHVPVKQA